MPRSFVRTFSCVTIFLLSFVDFVAGQSIDKLVSQTQAKMVKVVGAGGFAGLQSYQSGFFISPDGLVLTTWSHVLDGKTQVITNDGRRFVAEFKGMDPLSELAVIKIETQKESFFDLKTISSAQTGESVFAFSNLFGVAAGNEQQSVMKGVVAGVTKMNAKLGNFSSPYRGQILLLDLISNNPGAAGGALVNTKGELVGVLGKELKDQTVKIWLNHAIPATEIAKSVAKVQSGKSVGLEEAKVLTNPLTFELVGIELLPDVLRSTPPYIDAVKNRSTAKDSGLRADDLIVFINQKPIRTVSEANSHMKRIDRFDAVTITVRRDEKLITVQLSTKSAKRESSTNRQSKQNGAPK